MIDREKRNPMGQKGNNLGVCVSELVIGMREKGKEIAEEIAEFVGDKYQIIQQGLEPVIKDVGNALFTRNDEGTLSFKPIEPQTKNEKATTKRAKEDNMK